jgi:RAMA domain-containing protein
MARRKVALVSEYLEGISRAALAEYQQFFRERTRKRHGVYALYRGKRLYYVGLARDLRGRLRQHLKDRHGQSWDRFSVYLTIGDDHVRELEALVLRIVRPTGNTQLGKFGRASNLRRHFVGRVHEDARHRLDELLGREDSKPKSSVARARGRHPVLASYITTPMRLRALYKGKRIRARVLRRGQISYRRTRFNSPSLAARAAIGGSRAINGWTFWTYERAPGDWVQLKELRR